VLAAALEAQDNGEFVDEAGALTWFSRWRLAGSAG
jgi:predicted transcriptional regulator